MTDQGRETDTLVLAAVRRLMRPVVRALIHFGVTYPALCQVLKSLFVEVAAADFPLAGKEQTDSRITLLTGVHRKDVKRLRQDPAEAAALPHAASLGAQVLGVWLGDPAYSDAGGQPRVLPRTSDTEGEPSFDRLVSSVSKDVRPRAVLDDWVASGIVRVLPDDHLALDARAFVPRADFTGLAYYFGRNLRDHAAASAHNLIGHGRPMFERAVFYDRLTEGSVAALEAAARERGMALLTELNRQALAHADRDEGRSDADRRFTVGVYAYFGPDRPDGPDGTDTAVPTGEAVS